MLFGLSLAKQTGLAGLDLSSLRALGPRDFSMRVTGRFTSSLFRQVSEATQIADQVDKRNKEVREGREARTVMNSAREFRQPGIIRARHLKTFNY